MSSAYFKPDRLFPNRIFLWSCPNSTRVRPFSSIRYQIVTIQCHFKAFYFYRTAALPWILRSYSGAAESPKGFMRWAFSFLHPTKMAVTPRHDSVFVTTGRGYDIGEGQRALTQAANSKDNIIAGAWRLVITRAADTYCLKVWFEVTPDLN
ncbi:hypothetical protein [Halomonas sp. KO116]|uniref:hypothetical protein n=1 Tax=Halomonas sp. KO116 TaxID=1504981 RepID=UPI0011851DEA|nr:hypothetical protein [Halomonas sp. KO116]